MLKESEKSAAVDAARRKAVSEKEQREIEKATAASLCTDSGCSPQKMQPIIELTDSSPDDDVKPAARKSIAAISIARPHVASPPRRSKEEVQEETKQRVVSQLLEIADADGVTPNTEAASMQVIDMLSENNQNAYQLMVKSKSVKGTPAEGKSPEIASQLVRRKKSQMMKDGN